MQQQSSDFVHKCITGSYCLWTKLCWNEAGVTEYDITSEKFTPTYIMRYQIEMLFP